MSDVRGIIPWLRLMSTVMDRLTYLGPIVEELRQHGRLGDLGLREIIFLPGVAEIIDPEIAEFDADHLASQVSEQVPLYLKKREEEWRRSLESTLRHRFDLDTSCDPFSLAIGTWFCCQKCDAMMTLPSMATHPCCYDHCGPPKPSEISDISYSIMLQATYCESYAWHPPPLDLYFERQAAIIEICGFDVRTATVVELDEAKVRLRTVKHHDGCVAIMTWRGAVSWTVMLFQVH
jgi:hypothetical protein